MPNASPPLRCFRARRLLRAIASIRRTPAFRPRRGLHLTATTLLALAVLAPSPPLAAQQPQHFDLLIRGGRILDGTGNPWFRADIGVLDGRIAALGMLTGATADRVIDATGRYVSPGFIDIHSHADDGGSGRRASIRNDSIHRKAAPNVVSQGATTIVVNQDGRSPWPIAEQRATLERQGVGPNVLLMVGHGTVRRMAMGDDFRRAATAAETGRMAALVQQALEEGAVGISAGLEYVPGRWSTTDELVALVTELARYDGVYISHERAEGADPMWFLPSQHDETPPTLLDAVAETIEIGRRTGVRVVASHIKAKGVGYWGQSASAIEMIQQARDEGVRVWADQYPYPTSGTDGRTVLIPRWALDDEEATRPADARPPADMLEIRLRDPETAALIRSDITHEIGRRGGVHRIVVFEHPNEEYVGRSLGEIAAERGEDPIETAIALQLEGDRTRPGGGRFRGFSMSEDDVENYAGQPWVVTASDGGIAWPGDGPVHPRFYGTFPRKIRHYALTVGALTLDSAIRAQTSLPARIMGLSDRGEIREGNWADLVVFDLETISDEATFEQPHQHSTGIDHVLVNGEFVVDGGRIVMAVPGKVIVSQRGGRPAS